MIRKIFVALIVGIAVAYLARPEATGNAARDMLDAAGRTAGEAIVERCLDDPGACRR